MRERILQDLKESMKNRDKERLSVIRMVKSAIQMEEINKKRELNDEEIISIISKQIKTRKDSINEFKKGSRDDLIEATSKEIDILNEYLPEPLTLEEVSKIIDDVFAKVNPTSMKDMGKIMKEITPLVKGRYDMNEISSMVRSKLG